MHYEVWLRVSVQWVLVVAINSINIIILSCCFCKVAVLNARDICDLLKRSLFWILPFFSSRYLVNTCCVRHWSECTKHKNPCFPETSILFGDPRYRKQTRWPITHFMKFGVWLHIPKPVLTNPINLYLRCFMLVPLSVLESVWWQKHLKAWN